MKKAVRPATIAQLLSCEYRKIFKNSYLEEYLQTAASQSRQLLN